MTLRRFPALLFLLFLLHPAFAQNSDTITGKRFVFEAEIGTGMVNNYSMEPSFSFHAGAGNYVLTARFLRSAKGVDHIYENCWLAGYRFNGKKYFNATFSAGAGDLAFEHDDKYRPSNHRVRETIGLTLDAEVQFCIHKEGRPTRWLLYAAYYTTFNSYSNINGITFGLGFNPFKKPWKSYKEVNENVNDKRNKQLAETTEIQRVRRVKRAERNAMVYEHTDELHWEGYAFAGTAKRLFNGGFGTFFELKRFIFGANYTWESQELWKEPYHDPGFPPYITSWNYFKDKQTEKAVFAGYRVWETQWVALTLSAGPVWKNNVTLIGHEESYRMWYTTIYERKTVTGLTVQSELSYTFPNRAFGFGLIPFINIYKGYTSPGGVISVRFGFLR